MGFTFIDLFAGIGGMRIAFEKAGGECVFSSEWDKFAQQTYAANFGETPHGDITQVELEEVPKHDILIGGFPCQPFSHAGLKRGFEDTRGTLFFDVARIIAAKRPKAFVLENVKNLVSHDKGQTFKIILDTLTNELGYQVFFKIIDASFFVPQHRERIILIGFREASTFSWDHIDIPTSKEKLLGEILHAENLEPFIASDDERFYDHKRQRVLEKYTLSDKLWSYLQNYKRKHQVAGNGFGFGLVTNESITRTLSARYYKDGSEILVDQGQIKNPRRLTPRECARLMGFPDSFKIPVSDTRSYKQFGNSVVVPVFESIAMGMRPFLLN